MKNIFKSFLATVAILAAAVSVPAVAQNDSAVTSPTKVYASVGGTYTFTVSYTAEGFTSSDLLIGYTVNTAGSASATPPVLVPYPNCIDSATTAPYVGNQPNTSYVNFDGGLSAFPNSTLCGGAGGAATTTITLGTFTGTVASFPAGGSFVVTVQNNTAAGSTNSASNDVTVCQKTTVSGVTAPADAFEGTPQTFTVNFAAAVPAGCGGFAIPVTPSGTATAAPDNVVITTNNCNNVADAATSCTVTVAGVDDNVADGTKIVTLTVTDSTTASVYVSAGKSASANVLDNEVSGSVVATQPNASETGPTNGVVTFSRGGATTSPVDLTSVISGTATYGTDYTLTAGTCAIANQSAASITVTLAIGVSSCTVNVVPVEDQIVEGNETVIFAPPTGANVTSSGTAATVTIADNDQLPSVTVGTVGTCAEPATNCTFTITATSNTNPVQTGNGPLVPFTVGGTATNNTDYKLVLGASCAAAAFTGPVQTVYGTPTTLTVCVIDDSLVEGAETVVLTLTANAAQYSLGTAAATQSIADDDHAISVTAASGTVDEGQAAVFNLSCGGATGSITVNYTITGADPGVTITPSATQITLNCPTGGTVTVPTINDSTIGNSRQVTLTITGLTGAPAGVGIGTPSSATVLVVDNDVPRVIPTMSEVGLLLLGLMMAGVAGFAVRRRG